MEPAQLGATSRIEAFLPGSAVDVLRVLGAWTVPFVMVDAADNVLFWNRGAARLYGIAENGAVGRNFTEVVGETSASPHFTVQGISTPDGTTGALILVTDLTESKALERRLARRVAQLSVIREIAECLQSEMSLERILRSILVGATASQGLRFNRAYLLLVNEQRRTLEGRDGIGPVDADEAERIWSRLAQKDRTLRELMDEYEPIAEGALSAAQRTARRLTVSLDDTDRFLIWALSASATVHVERGKVASGAGPGPSPLVEILGVETFVVVPLKAADRPVGLLIADNAITKRAITPEDVDMLELLGLQAGHAIERTRLTDEIAREVAFLEAATLEIRKNQERLVQAERLSAIGEMAARVAHEIRNPLVAIGGFARSLLQRTPHPDETTRESLEVIVDEVRRLESIVGEVLDFSRQVPPRIGSLDLARLAREAGDLLRFELEQAGVRWEVDADERLPAAAADRDQIFQALVNVLRNAIHAMPKGGALSVRVRAIAHGLEVAVNDTGEGMPPEVLAHVFEPFYTTKPTGSGLGLTIAAQIVRDHHGELKLDSREGEGTTVTFRLPAVEGADAQDPGH
jgi:signal transduction histidine kinase